jgi:hypothetical protein
VPENMHLSCHILFSYAHHTCCMISSIMYFDVMNGIYVQVLDSRISSHQDMIGI